MLFEVAKAARERTCAEIKGVIVTLRNCYKGRKKQHL